MSPERTNWPIKILMIVFVLSYLSLATTYALDGEVNDARGLIQHTIMGMVLVRFVVASQRREQSRVWVVYLVGLILAAPLWHLAESLLRGTLN